MDSLSEKNSCDSPNIIGRNKKSLKYSGKISRRIALPEQQSNNTTQELTRDQKKTLQITRIIEKMQMDELKKQKKIKKLALKEYPLDEVATSSNQDSNQQGGKSQETSQIENSEKFLTLQHPLTLSIPTSKEANYQNHFLKPFSGQHNLNQKLTLNPNLRLEVNQINKYCKQKKYDLALVMNEQQDQRKQIIEQQQIRNPSNQCYQTTRTQSHTSLIPINKEVYNETCIISFHLAHLQKQVQDTDKSQFIQRYLDKHYFENLLREFRINQGRQSKYQM